jgi:hypothetical protein
MAKEKKYGFVPCSITGFVPKEFETESTSVYSPFRDGYCGETVETYPKCEGCRLCGLGCSGYRFIGKSKSMAVKNWNAYHRDNLKMKSIR